LSLYLALHLSLAGAVYEEAHRGSPCIYTAFTPLLQVVYGVCLKEWGKFTEMKNRALRRKAQQKGRSVKYSLDPVKLAGLSHDIAKDIVAFA
jgi:hypothetical protein